MLKETHFQHTTQIAKGTETPRDKSKQQTNKIGGVWKRCPTVPGFVILNKTTDYFLTSTKRREMLHVPVYISSKQNTFQGR